MYWIEICKDGSYLYRGQEYPLHVERIKQLESYQSAHSGKDWARIVVPFQLRSSHGPFCWDVEVIEYLALGVASFIGSTITGYPDDIILKDEVIFCLQDGWIDLETPT